MTGWITDSSTLSAPGKLVSYTSTRPEFGALYPETWTVAETPFASVLFRSQSGADTVVVSGAATAALLGRGRAGYRQSADEQVVVCGVTGDLVTYTQVSPPSTGTPPAGGVAAAGYLVQVRLALDAQHALGVDANLDSASQLQTVHDFVNSITFPFPQCQK